MTELYRSLLPSLPQLLRSLDDWSVLVHDADMVDALIDQKQVRPYTTHTTALQRRAFSPLGPHIFRESE